MKVNEIGNIYGPLVSYPKTEVREGDRSHTA